MSQMWVLRAGSQYLSRGGKHLSLCLVDDVRDASAFVKYETSVDEGDRAAEILGVTFKAVRMPVSKLIRKDKAE